MNLKLMYKKIAEDNDVPEFLMHNVHYHFFKMIKEVMANSEGETIHIQNWAKFRPSKRVVKKMLKAYRDKGNVNKVQELERIEKKL